MATDPVKAMNVHREEEDPQAEIISFLESPKTHGGCAVDRVDTHIAHVFLAGDRAYKLKRSVVFPYLDFSTVERRYQAAKAELRLNSKNAPCLYLGLQPVRRTADGGLSLDEVQGEIVDWLIVMRRFDQAALFDQMALEGRLERRQVTDLADAVLELHNSSPIVRLSHPKEQFAQIVASSLEELGRHESIFSRDKLDRLSEAAEAAIDRGANLIRTRSQSAQVRRCHGDLHLRNVVLWEGKPLIFDALEFDDNLATGDCLYDVAFLLMDFVHRGLQPLANIFLCRLAARSADYDDGFALLPLFMATRAMIRAKVLVALASSCEEPQGRERLEEEAVQYLDLALASFGKTPTYLVAIGGLSGSGKSTVAYELSPQLGRSPGAIVLRSDEERKRLLGQAPEAELPEEAYGPSTSSEVYASLRERAATLLAAGQSVVVDAVHALEEEREAIASVGQKASFLGVWLEAPVDTLRHRVVERRDDASDAGAAVLEQQLSYDLGKIGWKRVPSEGCPSEIAHEIFALVETLAE